MHTPNHYIDCRHNGLIVTECLLFAKHCSWHLTSHVTSFSWQPCEVDVTMHACVLSRFSHIRLCDPWTVARQAPLSMEFSRQEYWSGLICPPPADLPSLGIKPISPVFPVLQAGSLPTEPPGKPRCYYKTCWSLSHVRRFAIPWIVALQAPLPMEFSRQEYWSGLPFPSPGDLPDPRVEPGSPALQAVFYCLSHQGSPDVTILIYRWET